MKAAKTAAGLVGIETLVLEVVRPKSDILVGVFGPLADSCTATSTIPIAIEAAGDAVASGLVASCSRPRIRHDFAKPRFVSRDPRLRRWPRRTHTTRCPFYALSCRLLANRLPL